MADQPFLASNSFNGDGVTTVWEFSFEGLATDAPLTAKPYIDSADVRAELITGTGDAQVTVPQAFLFETANSIRVEPAVPVGTVLRVYRVTENRFPLVNYQDLQSVGASDLDLANRQAVYIVQEARDAARGAGNLSAEAIAISQGAAVLAAESADEAAAASLLAQSAAEAAQLAAEGVELFDTRITGLEDGGALWQRAPLAAAITTASQMLSTTHVNIWEYAHLVVTKPDPLLPSTWDWSPAVQGAVTALGAAGTLQFTAGTFKFSGVTTSKTISIAGQGTGVTILQNYTAGATMLTYDQVGVSDKERRNWLTFSGFTLKDEASFTGIGIKTNNVLSVIFRECYIRDFKVNYGLQILEALWVYLDYVSSDLCELNFVSVLVPHWNNVVCIRGGEIRNPTPGRSGLYVEGGDIISVRDATIEGNAGGAGYIAGGKFKNIKMLSIENTYFEVLQQATGGGLVLDNCQSVTVSRSQLNAQSTTVPSVLCVDSDAVEFVGCAMVGFPIRSTGVNSVLMRGCAVEGPMDLSTATDFKVASPLPYNTRAVLVTDPAQQPRPGGKPLPFRNSYADSSFEAAAPGVTIVAGAPVSSQDTTQGYFGTTSWRVTGNSGDTIRTASLGVTTSDGQSGCMSFMAKADTAGRFTLLSFLAGAAGGHDIYLSTEWRRYFVVTTLRPASTVGSQFLLQLGFQGTNAFNLTDIQFVPFTDYGEIPGIVDGFNYLPTHGATIPGAISQTTFPEKVYFDRLINLRVLPVYADNAAATVGGLLLGDLYRTAVGALHVRF